MGRKRREMSAYYTSKSPAEDDIYEALMYHYWGASDYARELIVAAVIKYESGGYSVEEKPKTPSIAKAEADDIDYDEAAKYAEYPWEGWNYHDATP